MESFIRLLIVEDSEDDAALLLLLLRQAGHEVSSERVDSAGGMAIALNKNWDIIISDHSMPHFSGTEALKMVRARDADVPFIFVSGTIGEDVATDAMRIGAQDYVMKTNLKRLVPAVQRELRDVKARKERNRLD
jgi:DNA-binding NtrC family response regulator